MSVYTPLAHCITDSKTDVCNLPLPAHCPSISTTKQALERLQYSCLENPHGQRNLTGYSPWGHKESDITELLRTAQCLSKTFLLIWVLSSLFGFIWLSFLVLTWQLSLLIWDLSFFILMYSFHAINFALSTGLAVVHILCCGFLFDLFKIFSNFLWLSLFCLWISWESAVLFLSDWKVFCSFSLTDF